MPHAPNPPDYDRQAIVLMIQKKLEARKIKFFRDQNEITYGDSIDSFMNRIGKGKVVIQVVSDKYLKSRFCMDEALRIHLNNDSNQKVFVVTLNELDECLKLGDLENLEYRHYWRSIIENIFDKINNSITDAVDRERVKRNYGVYIDIHDYIIEFIKGLQVKVNLNVPAVKNLNGIEADVEKFVEEVVKALEK
jgi:hypothetical protein